MSDYTPITGEIRERIDRAEHIVPLTGDPQDVQVRINLAWLKEKLDAIDAIHANLEAENAAHAYTAGYEYADYDRDGWIELPKDADGEYIHIGEAMEGADGHLGSVWLIGVNEVMFDNHIVRYANTLRHVKTDTWVRIIEDAADLDESELDSDSYKKAFDALVARCKALAGDAE